LTGARAYFGTDARAQELLVGAALAIVGVTYGLTVPKRFHRAIDGVGIVLLLVLGGLLLAGPTAPATWQDGGLLAFAVGVAILIVAAVQDRGHLRSTLAAGPLVAIGRISYGLYLFHLPVFAWIDASVGITVLPLFFLRLGVTAVLAWASYRFIEQPIRGGRGSWRVLVPVGVVVALVVLALGTTLADRELKPRSKTLNFALHYASKLAPHGLPHLLVMGGDAAARLNQNGGGAFRAGDYWVTTVGTPGCGLTTPSPSCRRIPDDVAAIAAAFGTDVVILIPDAHDVADTRAVDRIEAIRRAAGVRRVGVFTTPCGTGVARAEFDAALTRWALRHQVAVATPVTVLCSTGAAAAPSVTAVAPSLANLADATR
ncbi:MAG: acyltransferase, partial [Acidimicrobiia bacterium]